MKLVKTRVNFFRTKGVGKNKLSQPFEVNLVNYCYELCFIYPVCGVLLGGYERTTFPSQGVAQAVTHK